MVVLFLVFSETSVIFSVIPNTVPPAIEEVFLFSMSWKGSSLPQPGKPIAVVM